MLVAPGTSPDIVVVVVVVVVVEFDFLDGGVCLLPLLFDELLFPLLFLLPQQPANTSLFNVRQLITKLPINKLTTFIPYYLKKIL